MEPLLFFALILVAFYFLIIRPQRARARQVEQMRARVAPGVEVMTTAGLFGTVVEVLDDSVRLEVAPGVTVRFLTAAIGRVVSEDSTDGTDDTDGTGGADEAGGTDEPGDDGYDEGAGSRRTGSGE